MINFCQRMRKILSNKPNPNMQLLPVAMNQLIQSAMQNTQIDVVHVVYSNKMIKHLASALGIPVINVTWATEVPAKLVNSKLQVSRAQGTGFLYLSQPRPRDMNRELRPSRAVNYLITPNVDGFESVFVVMASSVTLLLRCGVLSIATPATPCTSGQYPYVCEGETVISDDGDALLFLYDLCVLPEVQAHDLAKLPYMHRLSLLHDHSNNLQNRLSEIGVQLRLKPFLSLRRNPYIACAKCISYMHANPSISFDGFVIENADATYTKIDRLIKLKFIPTVDGRLLHVRDGIFHLVFRQHTAQTGMYRESSIHSMITRDGIRMSIPAVLQFVGDVGNAAGRVVEVSMGVATGGFCFEQVILREDNKTSNFENAARSILAQLHTDNSMYRTNTSVRILENVLWSEHIVHHIHCLRWHLLTHIPLDTTVILDFGCGRGGDLFRWCTLARKRSSKLTTIVAVESAVCNITEYRKRVEQMDGKQIGHSEYHLSHGPLCIIIVEAAAIEFVQQLLDGTHPGIAKAMTGGRVVAHFGFSLTQIVDNAESWRTLLSLLMNEVCRRYACTLRITIVMHSHEDTVTLQQMLAGTYPAIKLTNLHPPVCSHAYTMGAMHCTSAEWCSSAQVNVSIMGAKGTGAAFVEALINANQLSTVAQQMGYLAVEKHMHWSEGTQPPHWLLQSMRYLTITRVTQNTASAAIFEYVGSGIATYRTKYDGVCLVITTGKLRVIYDSVNDNMLGIVGYLSEQMPLDMQ